VLHPVADNGGDVGFHPVGGTSGGRDGWVGMDVIVTTDSSEVVNSDVDVMIGYMGGASGRRDGWIVILMMIDF
jgi:hypothetical protein